METPQHYLPNAVRHLDQSIRRRQACTDGCPLWGAQGSHILRDRTGDIDPLVWPVWIMSKTPDGAASPRISELTASERGRSRCGACSATRRGEATGVGSPGCVSGAGRLTASQWCRRRRLDPHRGAVFVSSGLAGAAPSRGVLVTDLVTTTAAAAPRLASAMPSTWRSPTARTFVGSPRRHGHQPRQVMAAGGPCGSPPGVVGWHAASC
jgi:hypothetical protein